MKNRMASLPNIPLPDQLKNARPYVRTLDSTGLFIPLTFNTIVLVLFGLYWLFSQEVHLEPKGLYTNLKQYASLANPPIAAKT